MNEAKQKQIETWLNTLHQNVCILKHKTFGESTEVKCTLNPIYICHDKKVDCISKALKKSDSKKLNELRDKIDPKHERVFDSGWDIDKKAWVLIDFEKGIESVDVKEKITQEMFK